MTAGADARRKTGGDGYGWLCHGAAAGKGTTRAWGEGCCELGSEDSLSCGDLGQIPPKQQRLLTPRLLRGSWKHLFSGGVGSSSPRSPGHKATCLLPPRKGVVVPHCPHLRLAGPLLCPALSLAEAPSSGLITQGLEIKSHHRLIFINKNTRLGWDFYLFC